MSPIPVSAISVRRIEDASDALCEYTVIIIGSSSGGGGGGSSSCSSSIVLAAGL